MRHLWSLVLLVGCGSDDSSRHIVDGAGGNTVAAPLDGLRWELPCITDEGGNVCTADTAAPQTATISGSGHYMVVLRFRGVVEQRSYIGGTADGYFNTGGSTNNGGDTFNLYAMTVSSPAQTYFVNNGTSNIYNTFAIDFTETVPVDGGATVTLTADPVNGAEIVNVDPSGTPIVVPDIAPAPMAYNGQFVQMDVISVSGA